MSEFKGDDRAADGIPVEVKLDNGGYFEAYLMDIINGEALIHFLCSWLPESKYPFSHVRFPPVEGTPRSALQEKMIAEVLVNKNNGFHEGWFKCCIQMLKSEFCQFEYLDSQNGSDFGYTFNVRKPNINPKLSMDILHVHKISIPENLREFSKCEDVHKSLKDTMKSALVNYDADSGELVIISGNAADISRAKVLEESHLRSLSQQSRFFQVKGRRGRKVEMAKSDEFTTEFTIPYSYLGLAIGNGKVHLRAAQSIKGISTVQLIRKSNKFIIHGQTKEAVQEARELLEFKIEPYPVLEEHMSQLVGRESANIYKIIQQTGVAEINIDHNQDALENDERRKDLLLFIIGTVRAIEKAKIFLQFQIDHIYEVQRLREEKFEVNRRIANFVGTYKIPESVVSTYSETVKSTRPTVSSTNYNLEDLEELQNLNELLLEDCKEATDLDVILENINTREIDPEDNTMRDTYLEETIDINLEDTNEEDVNLEDINEDVNLENINEEDVNLEDINEDVNLENINEEDVDLENNTRRLNASMESNEDSSKILDIPTISDIDDLPGLQYGVQYSGYYVMRPSKEVEKVEEVKSNGFEFVEDPDFWTRDSVNTPSELLLETQDTTCQNMTKEHVLEEVNGVILEAVACTEQINDVKIIEEIHLHEENSYLEANSSTPRCYNGVEKPLATPRLSVLKKSKKFVNVSTETDDMIRYSSLSSSEEKSTSSKSETSSLCDSDISIKIGNTVYSGYLKYVHETSTQEEYIESQCDDQEPDCSLPAEEPTSSEDIGFEGQDSAIPLKDDKDSFNEKIK